MAAIAAACRAVGRALGDLVFPWHCLLCESAGPGLAAPFCDSCRAGLLERAGAYRAASCPRCASPVGPFADLKGGCSACRRRPWGSTPPSPWGPTKPPGATSCWG